MGRTLVRNVLLSACVCMTVYIFIFIQPDKYTAKKDDELSRGGLAIVVNQTTLEKLANSELMVHLGGSDLILNISELVKGQGPIYFSPDSPYLIEHIRSEIVKPVPGGRHLSAGWNTGPQSASRGQIGQIPVIVEYFKQKKDGYFIEAGAYDGEIFSNSLFLEVEYGWTGLLAEPNPDGFKIIKEKNRNVDMMQIGFSRKSYPEQVSFDGLGTDGKIDDSGPLTIQCYPLYSVILALGYPRIDLLSLDIEGEEFSVLSTVPWDKVDIQALLVEIAHTNETGVTSLLLSQGYRIHTRFTGQDILYVKR